MKKVLGIILVLFLIVTLGLQIKQMYAQLVDEPITGPITSPLTGPMVSPTETTTPTLTPTETPSITPTESLTPTPTVTMTPTPTLIETLTTTPTPTMTETPSPTPTETPTVTPTPAVGSRLGGLDLDRYCKDTNKPGLLLQNNTWFCDNGSQEIDLTKVCQAQFAMDNVVARQDISGNPWSWSCYVTEIGATPTMTPTETPTMMPTESVTPTEEMSPSISPEPTATPTGAMHKKNVFHFSFIHFPKGFPFTGFVNGVSFFNQPHIVTHATITAKTCSIHDVK